MTTPGATRVSLNIVYNGPATIGTTVQSSYIAVAEITFAIVGGGTATFSWRTVSPNATNVFKDDNATLVGAGTLNGYESTPLPVQIASFTAAVINQQGHVKLDWLTLSETNNYGFEVQKSPQSPNAYQTIPGSFIPGHGTTIDPHWYTYTDVTGSPGVWYYRLKQIDLSGQFHYTEGIQPTGLTGIVERPIPTEFGLSQNYPNPFNPATRIEFAMPQESHVKLEVYNSIGARVATLVDEVRGIGYHTVPFDASGLASGIYFYRFQSDKTTFTRKMMLLK
ncbi:MAG: T9SS type A sorting domain-containing protein [Ignavibacteriae bacterium]|nr:T9SS type A sorting domain-containing protein [Ignavibacteriota bacterium]